MDRSHLDPFAHIGVHCLDYRNIADAGDQPHLAQLLQAVLDEIAVIQATGPIVKNKEWIKSLKSVELAESAIDRNADQTTTVDERNLRKRELIEGPEAFRSARLDRGRTK